MDIGRSRGRASARGRGGPSLTEAEALARDSSSLVSAAQLEAATRGRGGIWRSEALNTIPAGAKDIVGDNRGNLKIVTNYFRLNVPNNQVIYSYRVDFEPQVESTKHRRGMLYDHRDVFRSAYVFDGGNEIKSLIKLDQSEHTIDATRKTDGEPIKITIKYTSTVGWGHPEMLRLYNTQMRRNFIALEWQQIGRDYYCPKAKKDMSAHKVEVWPGIMSAVNEHDGGLMMVNDVINKVVRKETCLDFLLRYRGTGHGWQNKVRDELVGMVVMTFYNNKTYKIDDIVWDRTPVSYTFDRRGTTMNLKDYYRQQYEKNCRDDAQPLFLVKPTERRLRGGDDKPILLIPEFCVMTGLTNSMAADMAFKRALGDLTRQDPIVKAEQLQSFVKMMNSNDKIRDEMRVWGLSFSETLVEVNARVLNQEKLLLFGDNNDGGTLYNQRTGSFEREIRSKRMRKPMPMQQWCLLGQRKDRAMVDDFFNSMDRICEPLGCTIGRPKIIPVESDRVDAYTQACREVPSGAKMVVIIVPNTNLERYSAIKKFFCLDHPIPSQVVTTRVLSNKKNLMSVATKIFIQMVSKIGGEPWGIIIPPRLCMIVGYDTYHDSQRKGYSVGGFVCTANQGATSWFSRTSYHQNREELSSNFASNFVAGLKNWHQKNGSFPERIIIYRDGVSEGQIPYVYNVEMQQVVSALKEKEELSKIVVAFIIVTKRINSRFFLKISNNKFENPPPGTLIDAVVTRKKRYDFYLISQCVRQGTVNPTMYNIIYDTTNWRPAHHQTLAYKLCHVYYNWAGTITVPAPCQYAHKLAYLTGTAIHKEHDLSLSDTLFFL